MPVPAQQPSSLPARLALVGEAPGQDEVHEGRPFVGKSGKVLNAALAAAGLERHELYLGNVFLEKAENNNVDPWLRDSDVLSRAVDRLNADLTRAAPTVIIPLGASALQALTGLTEISRVRGSPMISPGPVMPGVKMLPTFHPAFILRQWKMLPVLIDDLMRASKEADLGPGLVYPHKEFTLEPDLADIRWWMHGRPTGMEGQPIPTLLDNPYGHPQSDLISIDIETGWGQITCISFAPDADHSICVPFFDLRKPSKSYWPDAQTEADAWRLVKAICESPTPKLGQNFVYDAWWLLDQMGIRTMNYRHDTRLEHHALLPELPKDLSFMAAAYTSANWKGWGKGKEAKRDS